MRLSYNTRWLPKAGNRAGEYEDAFAPRRTRPARSVVCKRFAVADGASESLLAGCWAKLLVSTFCAAPIDSESRSVFAEALGRWPDVLAQYVAERERRGNPIQWFEEPGLERGAFATLVGLRLASDGHAHTWAAVAIGDSCLFHFRDQHLLAAFPRVPGDGFDTNPPLICSKAADLEILAKRALHRHGTFQVGDVFLLVTDAVAAWFLAAEADGNGAWAKQFFEAPTRRDFNGWVRGLREDGGMRNDDVTVMQISVEG